MAYDLPRYERPVQAYGEWLKNRRLTPGRSLLHRDIDAVFAAFEKQGIADVAQLKRKLSAPAGRAALAAAGIGEEYRKILKREIGSLEAKPVALADFPGADASAIADLAAGGIRDSRAYYESGQAKPGELLSLCDLVRISGVGAAAAKAFYEAGYRSVAQVAVADAAAMLADVSWSTHSGDTTGAGSAKRICNTASTSHRAGEVRRPDRRRRRKAQKARRQTARGAGEPLFLLCAWTIETIYPVQSILLRRRKPGCAPCRR
jgi:predicted flap endonuclease-1-like 5' DNA nuclease